MKDGDTASSILVLSDAGFQLPSPRAAGALSTATLLAKTREFSTFSHILPVASIITEEQLQGIRKVRKVAKREDVGEVPPAQNF